MMASRATINSDSDIDRSPWGGGYFKHNKGYDDDERTRWSPRWVV
jgi:hypothetical protein